jgi:hypothetical protein
MPAEHLGRLARNRLDLDAHLFAFPCGLHLLVVALDARHNAKIQELQKFILILINFILIIKKLT